MKKLLLLIGSFLLLFSVSLFAEDELDQVNDVIATETVIIPKPISLGVGIERMSTTTQIPPGSGLNTFSVIMDNRNYYFRIGANFGFADSFDDIIVGPKVQYIFFGKKHFELFAQTGIYFRRHLFIGNGVTGNLLAGIEFKIPEVPQVRVGFAYGIVWDTGDQNDISMNHDSVFGNMSIHYYF